MNTKTIYEVPELWYLVTVREKILCDSTGLVDYEDELINYDEE